MTSTTSPIDTTQLDPQVWKLFDQFVHGDIDRRSFVDRAARYCTGGMTAVGLLAALSPGFALAQKVAPQDSRIKTEWVEYASPAGYGKVRAYVARPAQATGPLPVILVAHENRGLNPHIEDIARRLALDNFIAVAPDALFPLGGYPGDEDKARELFAKLDQSKTREDWVVSSAYARAIAGGNGKLGVVGFCYGGSVANMLPTRVPEIASCAPADQHTPAPTIQPSTASTSAGRPRSARVLAHAACTRHSSASMRSPETLSSMALRCAVLMSTRMSTRMSTCRPTRRLCRAPPARKASSMSARAARRSLAPLFL